MQERLEYGILALLDDPFTPRSGADIKVLGGGKYQKYRLRVGDYRIIYFVFGSTVKLLEVWHRGRNRY